MESVFEVAKYIIKHEERLGRELQGIKLQKLLYYAQVYSLILEEELLFDTPFQAWRNGPVAPLIEREHEYYTIPNSFPGTGSISEKSVQVLSIMLAAQAPLDYDRLVQLTHDELPWAVADHRAEKLGLKQGGSWRREVGVNMSEHVKLGYKRNGNMVLPVALPRDVDLTYYSELLGVLSDEDMVEERAEELAESNFGLLAHITRLVPFDEYTKGCLVEAISKYWQRDPSLAKEALTTALDEESSFVQEKALRGLMRFYYNGDVDIIDLLDHRPESGYCDHVVPVMRSLLRHA